jgi:hypothetical protein
VCGDDAGLVHFVYKLHDRIEFTFLLEIGLLEIGRPGRLVGISSSPYFDMTVESDTDLGSRLFFVAYHMRYPDRDRVRPVIDIRRPQWIPPKRCAG